MACNLVTIQEALCESEIGKVKDYILLLQLIAQSLCDQLS